MGTTWGFILSLGLCGIDWLESGTTLPSRIMDIRTIIYISNVTGSTPRAVHRILSFWEHCAGDQTFDQCVPNDEQFTHYLSSAMHYDNGLFLFLIACWRSMNVPDQPVSHLTLFVHVTDLIFEFPLFLSAIMSLLENLFAISTKPNLQPSTTSSDNANEI